VEIAEAVIHGEDGVVTVGDDILWETVRLARFGDDALKRDGEDLISIAAGRRRTASVLRIPRHP
jgi:hypothetical protein